MDNSQLDEHIEILINICPERSTFNILNVFAKQNINLANKLYRDLKSEIIDNGYAESAGGSIVKLTVLGREVRKFGGHYAYKQKSELQKIQDEKIKLAEHENTLSSLKVNHYLYKTRWWPHVLALSAVVISLIALLKDCTPEVEPAKPIIVKETITQ